MKFRDRAFIVGWDKVKLGDLIRGYQVLCLVGNTEVMIAFPF
ncbi:hypothetical protein KPHES18084_19170 [Corynebacterium ulcerans]|nr:hypothetical protein CULTSU28_20270 [Corynebacterium ulcerans]